MVLPSNKGDVIYSYRYRKALPRYVREQAPAGMEWIIRGAGDGKYTFQLAKIVRIIPTEGLPVVNLPDATPQIVIRYSSSKDDEQALLAKVRYNRLIDVFLSITATSLQNHLRTKVKGIGQIEIDEFYVGVDWSGRHFVVPLQAKRGSDKLAVVQIEQDLAFCKEQYPHAIARPVAAQFAEDKIVMFELAIGGEDIAVHPVQERHYKLTPAAAISDAALDAYSVAASKELAAASPLTTTPPPASSASSPPSEPHPDNAPGGEERPNDPLTD